MDCLNVKSVSVRHLLKIIPGRIVVFVLEKIFTLNLSHRAGCFGDILNHILGWLTESELLQFGRKKKSLLSVLFHLLRVSAHTASSNFFAKCGGNEKLVWTTLSLTVAFS